MFENSIFNSDSAFNNQGSIFDKSSTESQTSIFSKQEESPMSAGTSNVFGNRSETSEEISNVSDLFNSNTSKVEDISNKNTSLYKQEYIPNATASVFDSRNQTKDSNNLAGMGNSSVFAELNMRERNEGNLSVIDRMRGIEGKRLDNSGEISLADQYNDKALDKRAMGGAYNITLSDTYKDKKLWNEVHGLNTDGFVKNEDEDSQSFYLFNKEDSSKKETKEVKKGPVDLTKKIDFSKNSWEKEGEEDLKTTEENKNIGASAGLFDTDFGKEKTRFKENKKDVFKKSKIIGVDKNSIIDYSEIKSDPVSILTENDTESGVKRVRLNEEIYVKAKEINLKYGKEVISSQELEDMERGGAIPLLLLDYQDLKNKVDSLTEISKNESLSDSERETAKIEISKIKPIMFKKAIEGI